MAKSKSKTKGKGQTHSTMRGQAKPQDSAASVFWDSNEAFSELFNIVVFKRNVVNPKTLKDARDVESAWIQLSRKMGFFLKNTRDNCKESDDIGLLSILGLENMTTIDYQMAFRVMLLDTINYGRQINIIEAKHRAEEAIIPQEEQQKITGNEYLGRFRKTDKIKRAITLVIYYGKEPWDGPKRLFDMMEDPPLIEWEDGYPTGDYPMYILDVGRMPEELLDQFSSPTKDFLGFLKYERQGTDELHRFVLENESFFRSAPPITMNALVELTGSKELKRFMEEFKTPEGGTNMCEGIKYYGDQRALEARHETFVETAQQFNHSLKDTIAGFMNRFDMKPEEAEQEVKKYWKN
ncbi:MAG: hypothetical protein IJ719_13350 [Clostridia bacterium]|nr:hypothetical protein [Clostridia bacterium]